MRGRKRKPTALHVVGGTYRKDRHGDRLDNQAEAEPLGPCPSYFADNEIARAVWGGSPLEGPGNALATPSPLAIWRNAISQSGRPH